MRKSLVALLTAANVGNYYLGIWACTPIYRPTWPTWPDRYTGTHVYRYVPR